MSGFFFTFLFAKCAVAEQLPTNASILFAQELYKEVIRFQPLGYLDYEYAGRPERKIVDGPSARKRFMPFLSAGLRRRIILRDRCLRDWKRQNPEPNLKAPSFEGGIFSGGNEEGEPTRFKIIGSSREPDGTFTVSVMLSAQMEVPKSKWTTWEVQLLLKEEAHHLVTDDVLYLNTIDTKPKHDRLSQILEFGCDGSRWVGHS